MLLVNADDFGMSDGVNAGIVEAHRDGIVTSTTWLAAGDAAEAAVELATDCPQLDVGLHLALTGVPPVGDARPFRRQLDAEGRWPSGHVALVRWLVRTPDARRHVRAEWRAQAYRFQKRWSRPPTHLDSHQHVALLPSLQRIYVELAAELRIPVRIPQETR